AIGGGGCGRHELLGRSRLRFGAARIRSRVGQTGPWRIGGLVGGLVGCLVEGLWRHAHPPRRRVLCQRKAGKRRRGGARGPGGGPGPLLSAGVALFLARFLARWTFFLATWRFARWTFA